MNRFVPLLVGLTAFSFLGFAQAQSFNPSPSATASKVFEAPLPKAVALEPRPSKASPTADKARVISKASTGSQSDGRPRFNPSASQEARALLAPPSAFNGPQSFNPSISPEARVLLAPVSKADERRARIAAAKREREARALAGPEAKDRAEKGEDESEAEKSAATNAASKPAPKDPSAAQLDLIRSRLIEAAQRSNINVRSLAWVDSDGKLHEASRFDSDARVRGVRVNSYLGDSSVELGAVEARPKDCSADDLRFAR
ncbi:MAG: hypothetical protein ACO3CJ_10085, partial [Burkholderiaceae bacterium]